MRYDFEWDPQKAKINLQKHGVDFERATSIFRDPHALSIPDEEHSEYEERWITIGNDDGSILLIASHTFRDERTGVIRIRIISARKATKEETKQYEEGI